MKDIDRTGESGTRQYFHHLVQVQTDSLGIRQVDDPSPFSSLCWPEYGRFMLTPLDMGDLNRIAGQGRGTTAGRGGNPKNEQLRRLPEKLVNAANLVSLMKITETRIPDVKLIEPRVFGDERGLFMETWNEKAFREAGIDARFVQDNHSRSGKSTLRGLHYQIKQPQGKLVRVTRGEVFDVAVDLRVSSPTFGQWVGEHLSDTNYRMLWVPPGFAHGFLVTSEAADFQYKCTAFYAPDYERSIAWDDAEIGSEWNLAEGGEVLLSDKDQRALSLQQALPELKENSGFW